MYMAVSFEMVLYYWPLVHFCIFPHFLEKIIIFLSGSLVKIIMFCLIYFVTLWISL